MCGRFTLTTTVKDLMEILPALQATEAILPRYNIAPSQPILAVANDDPTHLTTLRWGLVPRWASDESIGNRLINARAESLADKPAFRDAFRSRRCLVLADGFYEWKKLPGRQKQPFLMWRPDGKPFAFAGLWDEWRSPQGPLRSCTIVTTDASEQVRELHDRMPAILEPADFDRWLAPEPVDPASLRDLLVPSRHDLTLTPVSRLVNSPANESAECIEPEAARAEPEPQQRSLF
jgi:putative SOS response-associated peptidase YedK